MIKTGLWVSLGLGLAVATAEETVDPVYQDAVGDVLPFEPEQIRDFKQRVDAAGRARAAPPRPFDVRNRSLQLSTAPDAKLPVLALYPNLATTVVVLDATGQPWPIEKIGTSGTRGKADYIAAEQIGIATVLVSSGVHNAYGTVDLKLQDLDRTVKLLVTHGWVNDSVDGQVEIHLDLMGPLAAPQLHARQTLPKIDPTLLDFLNGIPPSNAVALNLSGDPTGRAWSYQGKVVLLTQNPLISPNPIAQTQSSSGRKLYMIDPIDIVLVSIAGRQAEIVVEMP